MKHKQKVLERSLSSIPKHKVPESFKHAAEEANLAKADDGLLSPLQPLSPRRAWGKRRIKELQGVAYPPKPER